MVPTVTPLRAERLRRPGLTQKEVADAVGMEKSCYCRLELGEKRATAEQAEALAIYFALGREGELKILYPERYMAAQALEKAS